MASEWCHNVFTVMAPTAFSLFAHITGIVFTSEVNLLRLTWGNIYSIFRSDSETNFTNMRREVYCLWWQKAELSPRRKVQSVWEESRQLPLLPYRRYFSGKAGRLSGKHLWEVSWSWDTQTPKAMTLTPCGSQGLEIPSFKKQHKEKLELQSDWERHCGQSLNLQVQSTLG